MASGLLDHTRVLSFWSRILFANCPSTCQVLSDSALGGSCCLDPLLLSLDLSGLVLDSVTGMVWDWICARFKGADLFLLFDVQNWGSIRKQRARSHCVGRGLYGDGLLLFPLQQAEFGWAWNWLCGANWESQDSDSPVFSRLDPIFSVSFFSGSAGTSNKECLFEMEVFAIFCVLLPAPYKICLRSLRTSVVKTGWELQGMADTWHSASPFHSPSPSPEPSLRSDQNPFIIAAEVDMAGLLESARKGHWAWHRGGDCGRWALRSGPVYLTRLWWGFNAITKVFG